MLYGLPSLSKGPFGPLLSCTFGQFDAEYAARRGGICEVVKKMNGREVTVGQLSKVGAAS